MASRRQNLTVAILGACLSLPFWLVLRPETLGWYQSQDETNRTLYTLSVRNLEVRTWLGDHGFLTRRTK